MQQNQENVMMQSREEKLTALGFLCYNLYIDGSVIFPEITEVAEEIKKMTSSLHTKAEELEEKIMELGCICYNLYVDKKLFNSQILSLCDSISSINYEIKNGLDADEYDFQTEESENTAKKKGRKKKNVTNSRLKVSCPYGMEPIPANYKRCLCGYRNVSVARFCGKCGSKLS